ncbi:MAG: hypothetical protein R3A47_12630 [Polyangiales bacterium]
MAPDPDLHRQLELQMLAQPDDTTCGPTCLHAVYQFWGHTIPLDRVIAEVPVLPDGGTLAVALACHALKQGFDARIYTYNLQIFDPSWFTRGTDISEKLRAQAAIKHDKKLSLATENYLEFLRLGGSLRYEELTAALLRKFLSKDVPCSSLAERDASL